MQRHSVAHPALKVPSGIAGFVGLLEFNYKHSGNVEIEERPGVGAEGGDRKAFLVVEQIALRGIHRPSIAVGHGRWHLVR